MAQFVKNPPAQCGYTRDMASTPGWERSLEEEMATHSSGFVCGFVLPRQPHGQRSLAGYSPWGHKESDMTEHAGMLLYCLHDIFCQTDILTFTWRICNGLLLHYYFNK